MDNAISPNGDGVRIPQNDHSRALRTTQMMATHPSATGSHRKGLRFGFLNVSLLPITAQRHAIAEICLRNIRHVLTRRGCTP
jgi:hypothetical protein